MKLLFFGISFVFADPVSAVECNRVEGQHGETITCPNDDRPKYVTGLCTSAQSTHCGSNSSKSHEYICCNEYDIQPHRHCYNLYGGFGQKQECKDPTDILIGGCASGRYEDQGCPRVFEKLRDFSKILFSKSLISYPSIFEFVFKSRIFEFVIF